MKIKLLSILFLGMALLTPSLSAKEFDLKRNMMKLNVHLSGLQRGFIKSDKKTILNALKNLETESHALLSDKDNLIKLLPKKMKNKRHKVNIAFDSARKIKYNAKVIRDIMDNKKKMSTIKKQAIAQEAYGEIVNACFKCHNLVRDKSLFRK